MKTCSTCKNPKDETEFYSNVSKKDGLSDQCRTCKKTVQAAWYQRHKREHGVRAKKARLRLVNINKKLLDEYLRKHPCIDCGEPDIEVLQFDHVRGQKQHAVSQMVCWGISWKKVLNEINKCDIRCANCHQRATNKRRVASFNGEAAVS